MDQMVKSKSAGLLAHELTGSGETTVVFLHGVFMDRHLWDDIVIDGVQRLVVDMPGHGASDPVSAATIEDHVAAVAQLLDDYQLESPIIVGHSWGGMVALRLAQKRSLGGVVFTNTPLRRTAGTSRLGFHAQRAMLALGLPAATYGKLAASSLIGEATRKRQPELVEAAAVRAERIGRSGLSDTLRSVLLEPDDSLDLLAQLDAPWTFVAGRDDYVLANGTGDDIGNLGDLVLVDGAHTTPIEAPLDLVRIINDFLEQHA